MQNTLKRLAGAAHQAVAYRTRIEALARMIGPWLAEGDRVLDVGCGCGALAAACEEANPAVAFEGLERAPRGGEPIPVTAFDGGAFPFADASFDVVVLADVAHHDRDPERLLRECRRVSRRLVLLKDHWHRNAWQYARICLLDWAANFATGVPCLYRYGTPESWRRLFGVAGLGVVRIESPLKLYTQPFEWLLGGGLHFFAVLTTAGRQIPSADKEGGGG